MSLGGRVFARPDGRVDEVPLAGGDVRERDGAGGLAVRRRHPLVEPEPGGQVLGIPGVGLYPVLT